MDNASDYGSEDSRFDSWLARRFFPPVFYLIPMSSLLRKATATDFLQIREKRSSECFPGGCSTEISEAGELVEADVGYVYKIILGVKSHRSLISTLKCHHFTRSAIGPEGAGAASGNRRLQQTQAQVDEMWAILIAVILIIVVIIISEYEVCLSQQFMLLPMIKTISRI
ncbi:hypothetical protein L3Q82_025040 [Scortum barcoo]|uniref:Uncharacterized protein n=1 Tax=Scortum barcoo TaxID=214431 RepID=A0ACB8WR08_9TELE|nr:hypothetical protein L3Q82_025040 [Scortum barcoo]